MFGVHSPPPPQCSRRCDKHRRRGGAPSASHTLATSLNPYKCANTLLTGGEERWQPCCACNQKADFYCWQCAKPRSNEHLKLYAWEKRGGVKRHDPVVSFHTSSSISLVDWTYFGKAKTTDRSEERNGINPGELSR